MKPEELCELILAKASGAKVERLFGNVWLDHASNIWNQDDSYRLKKEKKKCRVAKMSSAFASYLLVTQLKETELDRDFIAWLGDWIEYD